VRALWDRIPPFVRGLALIALVAIVVIVLSLEPVLAAIGGILSIAFFLAIAFFLFLVWRERRGDLEAWSEWNRRLFYAAIVLAVVDIGLAIGLGFPAGVGAFAFLVVLALCAYVVVRVWRIEHRY
jgi:purine-cytosine permease-like protein